MQIQKPDANSRFRNLHLLREVSSVLKLRPKESARHERFLSREVLMRESIPRRIHGLRTGFEVSSRFVQATTTFLILKRNKPGPIEQRKSGAFTELSGSCSFPACARWLFQAGIREVCRSSQTRAYTNGVFVRFVTCSCSIPNHLPEPFLQSCKHIISSTSLKQQILHSRHSCQLHPFNCRLMPFKN